MKAFLSAVITALLIAGIASYALEAFQQSSDVANTGIGARVDFGKDGIDARRQH